MELLALKCQLMVFVFTCTHHFVSAWRPKTTPPPKKNSQGSPHGESVILQIVGMSWGYGGGICVSQLVRKDGKDPLQLVECGGEAMPKYSVSVLALIVW